MEFAFSQVGNIAGQRSRIMMHGLAGEDPAHVGPPFAIEGRMWIAFLIRKLMMNAMRGHPENGSAFEGQCRADRKEVFHPFWRLVSAMSQQPVIAHANAQAPRNPPQEHRKEKSLPGEKDRKS